MASTPLPPAGYTEFVLDGGWSQSPNGSGYIQHLDAYGRPTPAPERYPNGFTRIAAEFRRMGLKFGLWAIRGVHIDAVRLRLPVYGMEHYTLDELVDSEAISGGRNGSCLWAPEWLGINATHPAAAAYYAGVVEQLVDNLGADLIKADCFFCRPCYTDEMNLMSSAVKAHAKNISLYYSPGGGALVEDGQWVASIRASSFYRTITDFDEGNWYGWGEFFVVPC